VIIGDAESRYVTGRVLIAAHHIVFLPGVLSRKKQVFPKIISVEDEI
jgi:hypothetical protein